jgi:glutamine synthetase
MPRSPTSKKRVDTPRRSVAPRPPSTEKPAPTSPIDFLRDEFARRRIRHVKLGGFDVDGVLRGKYVSVEKFFSTTADGLGFCDVIFGWDSADVLYDNATVTGWHTGYPDALAKIDLSTFRVLPWEPDTAAFLLDFVNADGSPYEPSPRQLLQRVVARADAMGFRPKFGSEYEFFIFNETPHSLRSKRFGDLQSLTPGMFGYSWVRSSANATLVHALLDGLRDFNVPVEGFHTETGPGVYEGAVLYDECLAAADKAALFKTATKEICSRHGFTACFMAKWNAHLPGCSGHLHQSLWDPANKKNLFHDPAAAGGMSETMRHYLGGQIALMPELTALYWPTVNSYKRRVENTWAPTRATWGIENRTTAIRVIAGTSGKSMRIEYRQTAADMNPYIAMATCLAAGLHGIENRIEPPEPCRGNAYEMKESPLLPSSLGEAVRLLRGSETATRILGAGFVDHYARTREWEWRVWEQAVTTWELERYLEII